MKSFAWLRARPRSVASVGVLTAGAVAITTMAFVYQGFPTTEVDLNDGGVWVTKQSSLLVGHFNHESRVLDGGLRTASDQYDILQTGNTVLVVDGTDSSVTTVDPAMVSLSDSASVPSGASVVLGGPTVAILDPASGSLWVLPAAAIAGFQVEGTPPTAELGTSAAVTVGSDGTVYAVSTATSEVVTVPIDADGSPGDPKRQRVDGIDAGAKVSITAVGDTAVVLDSSTGTLVGTNGLRRTVTDADAAVLQQPSGAADAVAVATKGALLQVPLNGSDPASTSAGAQGAPAAPVSLNGCVYAAWSGSARFVRDCVGDADDRESAVEGAGATAQLKFRVNRDVVVLNDIVGGTAWMASDSMQQVDNWNDITPPEGQTEENDEKTTEQTVETTLPQRSDVNTVPIATDDDFGVRPGRTTILPVLDNDTDADGDVLTV
ncbi:MAG: hypothetical protein KKH75_01490, partial [Actinobacteria bacterium]|nr:hypothetical protein [Actinomycetota bacterium]